MQRFPTALVIGVALLATGCSSSAGGDRVTPTTGTRRSGVALSFRAVNATAKAQNGTCGSKRRGVDVWLPDRERKHCYAVGPALIERSNLASDKVLYDDATDQWVVDVHFADDEFLDQIAGPMVNRQIAIVFDGVVLSAPTVNPGIVGREVQISSDFSEAEAKELAGRLGARG